MNLIEALKTGRPIRRTNNHAWFIPTTDQAFTRQEIIATTWEVEPERYEFECTWKAYKSGDDLLFIPWCNGTLQPYTKKLLGKRCKVTVEVLE